MKTDLIEIFQTIRASMQPYATLGFDNRINSETVYDLWSNKNVEIDGSSRNEVFFTSVAIKDNDIAVHVFPQDQKSHLQEINSPGLSDLKSDEGYFKIDKLDDQLLAQIEEAIAAAYKIYKDKGWVV
ncbi:MAG: hypothetical protein EOO89_01105 [Pedobacter sp.]|nr:MAG: hypothetical protein EOO89_01105 [Pedobacter sp.]